MVDHKERVCIWVPLEKACEDFAKATAGTQGAEHIIKMHWHVACRLVLEGGFHPDQVKPHPPFRVQRKAGRYLLLYDPSAASGKEATVFGGLKTKNIDVAVTIPEIGPCVAISMKGILNAFRNLTNRLEEAVGDCTNVHIAYPALVYGFIHLLRGNREGHVPTLVTRFLQTDPRSGLTRTADVAIRKDGELSEFIRKYGAAMERLTGRKDLRDDPSRYEAIALLVVEGADNGVGHLLAQHPQPDSSLRFESFFANLYRQYELRFVYGAPDLQYLTRRLEWDPESPALREIKFDGFDARTSAD
ncbi:MAG: hypothetical protein WD886_07805 [Burkholderiales bacterium]